jgi:hypothetical protein
VLNDLQNEPSAWPFVKPVDKETVADYYDVITEPMGGCLLANQILALTCRFVNDGVQARE